MEEPMSADNEICRMDAATVAAKVRDKQLSAADRSFDKIRPIGKALRSITPTVVDLLRS